MQTYPNVALGNGVSGSSPDFPHTSGVSWGAIFAGAAGAAALSLILLILGFGLGFSAISPWAHAGASAGAIGIAAVVWLTFTQIAASGLGGYLAGRLRTRWAITHPDEVYFRDTAHGFLAWAVASLVTVAFFTGTVTSIITRGAEVGTAAIATGAAAATATATKTPTLASTAVDASHTESAATTDYSVDSLFRSDSTNSEPAASDGLTRTEVARIYANDLRTGNLSGDDKRYLGQVIAKHTGLSQAEAEKRVEFTFEQIKTAIADATAKAKQAVDTARKAAAYSALWMFVALLCGAFFASLFATLGGKRRDNSDLQHLPK